MSSPDSIPASHGPERAGEDRRGRWTMRVLVASLLVGAVVLALAGPRAEMGVLTGIPQVGTDVDAYVAAAEAEVPGIRPGDGKAVVWAHAEGRVRTPRSIVYLHGFSADRHEVEPLITDLARDLGANVFFTRLTGHGRDGAAMGEATVDAWLRDAAEAVEVGRAIGERVVLVGTSTGGTLALWAASRPELAEALEALVLLSPNLHPRDRMSRLLLWPWGGVLARLVEGEERCFGTHNEAHARHWTECYPTAALLPMMALVEHVRTSRLEEIRTPALVVYAPGDQVVDPGEIEEGYRRLGSEPKVLFPVDDPGDPEEHVPAGDILSPGATDAVAARIRAFLAELVP